MRIVLSIFVRRVGRFVVGFFVCLDFWLVC